METPWDGKLRSISNCSEEPLLTLGAAPAARELSDGSMHLPFDQQIPFLGIETTESLTREIKGKMHRKFTASLFITGELWKAPRHPSRGTDYIMERHCPVESKEL